MKETEMEKFEKVKEQFEITLVKCVITLLEVAIKYLGTIDSAFKETMGIDAKEMKLIG